MRLAHRVLQVRCWDMARGSKGEQRGLIATTELGSMRTLNYLLCQRSGRKPHDQVASLGAHSSPRPSEAPFLEESRLQRHPIVAVAVVSRLDTVQIDRVRHHDQPCPDVTAADAANPMMGALTVCACVLMVPALRELGQCEKGRVVGISM